MHRGDAAATAEALMRSRYSAFAVGESNYLLETWHPRTRPDHLDLDPEISWTRLVVVRSQGGPFDTGGFVEFEAHHRLGSQQGVLRERSRFVRESGRWYYVDGSVGETSSGRAN